MKTTSFAFKAYAVAFLTLVLGAVLSVNLGDWTWFSRSGCLIVINGIILTSHQIIDHIRQLDLTKLRDRSQFNRDWAESDKHHFIHDESRTAWMSEKYGLYMLVLGTFVWGFGDLVGQL